MYSKVCILATVLPVAFGLILSTPTNVISGGISSISWTVNSTDPTEFSVMLNSLGSTDITPLSSGIASSNSPDLIMWPMIPAGDDYTMIAVNTSNIEEIYAQSDEFTITPYTAASISLFDAPGPTSASADTLFLASPSSSIVPKAQPIVQNSSIASFVTLGRRNTVAFGTLPTVVIVGIVIAFVAAGVFLFLGLRNHRLLKKENPEDGMKANATNGVTLAQLEAGALGRPEPFVLQYALDEQSMSLISPHDAILVPPATSFVDPIVFPPLVDAPSLHREEALFPAEDALDSGSLITISTTHARRGAVRWKVASVAHDTSNASPQQNHPERTETTHHGPDINESDSQSILHIGQGEQDADLIVEESALLLELREVQIARRLEAIRSNRTQNTTPPPEYAST